MNVKELKEELNKFDDDFEVLVYDGEYDKPFPLGDLKIKNIGKCYRYRKVGEKEIYENWMKKYPDEYSPGYDALVLYATDWETE